MPEISIRTFRRGIRSLERQVELALGSQAERCGVTPAQCHLLLAIEEAGESSVGELVPILDLDASTLSRTADALVKAGLLSRREDPANRRRQLVELTAAGKRKADTVNALCDRYYGDLLAALAPDEAETVAKALPLLADAMRDHRGTRDLSGRRDAAGGARA